MANEAERKVACPEVFGQKEAKCVEEVAEGSSNPQWHIGVGFHL
jgi:hypothetical protein